ncbi:hypothetical protein O4H53_12620 [Sulfitobacter sp. G21635-S1]|nr:hypothetical protein [Sulfitobacter sp. G21635-S1]MCZ4256386.1 hypothetical protein [Sulfitobacter sp. G21635-S1]
MLSIYASAMQTATRTDCLSVRSILPGAKSLRLRWWQRARTSCIDLSRL